MSPMFGSQHGDTQNEYSGNKTAVRLWFASSWVICANVSTYQSIGTPLASINVIYICDIHLF